MTSDRINVVLVDDHELVRRGLRDFLAEEQDFEVVGEAGTAAEALSLMATIERIDVAVLDVRLPDGTGVEVCREIRSRWQNVKCLMLTSFEDDHAMLNATLAGASGYLLKETRTAEILAAIRKLAAGGTLLDEQTTKQIFDRLESNLSTDVLARLSPQERRILGLMGEGLSNRQISEHLHLAEQTVKNYVSRILGKIGVERRTQAVLLTHRPPPSEERRTQ